MTPLDVLILAVLALFGPAISGISVAIFTTSAARRAQGDAAKAQLATVQAQADASKAQQAAAEAAIRLVEAAKVTDARLMGLADGQREIQRVAVGTHAIVNNQRTVLLAVNARLARRIADENPHDIKAQQEALLAEQEAGDAQSAQNEGVGRTKR